MQVDFLNFADAVENKLPKRFFVVGDAPVWLSKGLSQVSFFNFVGNVCVLLSSETAEAKLRKHFTGENLNSLIDVIAFLLSCETPEVYEGKHPNSLEAYFEINQELWVVVFKSTVLKEIIVKTVHRTDARNLQTARRRRLLYRA